MSENLLSIPTTIDTAWHPLVGGNPPEWASEWGQDRYGVFVAFTYREVTQRLRWIPPGRFLMGSPEDEPGRWEDEGTQHPVYITRGFWLFDTQCTQALWQAVMGDSPSEFKSPTRPVETVSWEDAQIFMSRLNAKIDGLNLVLPTEAQWEHACRAGTDTAVYSGPMEILGESHAPALDAIAWYGGNSGVDFDLTNGYDSSSWPEKQFPHTEAGTRPVGLKKSNPWGLYDMLGNFREWCADGLREYGAQAAIDPIGPTDAGAGRVVRGGSWDDDAGGCRSAYRYRFEPDFRDDVLGFRCARVQS